jgi:anhydro-N-acetylmuramic acid kinase
MIVAGVMSGTSADGIDVALVRISDRTSRGQAKRPQMVGQECPTHANLKLLGHRAFPYSAAVRRMVLASMNSPRASVADLARLNFLLGDLYAEAVLATQKKLGHAAELIGCHGQTLYHQGQAAKFLGRQLAVTWQIGEASRIAARVGVPVVSDFRPADMATGGKGAPLVPYLDYLLYRDPSVGRIALNIGGIANLTALPARASINEVLAFDTGPGNMIIDALSEQLFGHRFDRDGKIAARGRVLDDVVTRILRDAFFRQKPPKTAGREEFGREFVKKFQAACVNSHRSKNAKGRASASSQDAIATATALTARSIADAIKKHILRHGDFSEVIVSGGGAKNPTLMAWLANELHSLGLRLRSSDEFGIPSEAKEAVAFAVLAFETWNRRASNVPSATGAKRPAILGKISYA